MLLPQDLRERVVSAQIEDSQLIYYCASAAWAARVRFAAARLAGQDLQQLDAAVVSAIVRVRPREL